MKRLFVLIPLSLVLLVLLAGGGFVLAARLSPLDADILYAEYHESWRFLDRHGDFLRDVVNPEGNRSFREGLGEMAAIADAVVAVEDSNFRQHLGVDLLGLVRAVFSTVDGDPSFSGGSTITMQLARLVMAHPRDLGGKIGQIWDALRLEGQFSKDQILEAYLNLAPFAPGIQGAGAASRVLFGLPPSRLGPGEAALLAGLLKAPSNYDPRLDMSAAVQRRNLVLDRMAATARLDLAEAGRLKGHMPQLFTAPAVRGGHFTDWIMKLSPRPGIQNTSLDLPLQLTAENLVRKHVETYRSEGIGNSAVVVLDAQTAEVRAMVGSADWSAPGDGAVNGALARRQPGSTLKPFAYQLALEKGYTPASILADVETEYYGTDRTLYIPQNYSHSFRGPVSIQEALSASLNIPAIRLVQDLGVQNFLERLRDLGFGGLGDRADQYGLGLVLGNGEVSLLELAGAYGTLARGGNYRVPGYGLPSPDRPVLDPMAASLVTAILSDDWLRSQAFGQNSALLFDFPLAVKTGTSNNWRDTWVAGYSADWVIACWSGNFDASPTNQLSGSVGAGPLFNKVVRTLADQSGGRLKTIPPRQGQRTVVICTESGMHPGPHCAHTATVQLGPGEVLEACTVHRELEIDIRSGTEAGPGVPSRFVKRQVYAFLPPDYDRWQLAMNRPLPPRGASADAKGASLALLIQKPRHGDVYILEPGYNPKTQSVPFRALVMDSTTRASWVLDGKVLRTLGAPFSHDWVMVPGKHRLVLRQGSLESDAVEFEVR